MLLIDQLPRPVDTILLDYDGTIVDLRPKWWTPIEESFLEISGHVPEDDLIKNISQIMQNMPQEQSKLFLLKLIWQIGRSGGLSRFQTVRFVLNARRKFSQSRHIVEPFPGVEKLFDLLDHHDVSVAIVTTADKKEIKTAKNKLTFLKKYPVITRDDVEKLKPDPEPVFAALNKLNKPAINAVFIGDFQSDIVSGKQAGTMTIGLTGVVPELSEPRLREAKPDLIIQYLTDLLDIIMEIN